MRRISRTGSYVKRTSEEEAPEERAAIARLAGIVARGQDEKTLRGDVRPEDAAAILLATVVGAQTLMELRVSVDLGPAAAAMLTMLRTPEE